MSAVHVVRATPCARLLAAHPIAPRVRFSSPSRVGFTLLELMIVLTLIAFLMAMAWPSLRKPLDRSATQEAARQLARDLGQARLNAIESGQTLAMRFELEGSRYWVGPAEPGRGDDALSTARDTGVVNEESGNLSTDEETDDLGIVLAMNRVLEEGVVFRDPDAVEDDQIPLGSTLGEMLLDEMAETEEVEPLIGGQQAESAFSAPVLFYPTGRAENAVFVLRGPDDYSVTVTLRGLTGAVMIGALTHPVRTTDDPREEVETRREREDVESMALPGAENR